MKLFEKNRQYLCDSQVKTANSKYFTKRLKISLNSIQDYMEYMNEKISYSR